MVRIEIYCVMSAWMMVTANEVVSPQMITLETSSQRPLKLREKYERIATTLRWFENNLRKSEDMSPDTQHHQRLFKVMTDYLLHFISTEGGSQIEMGLGPELIFNRPWQELTLLKSLVEPALVAVRKSCEVTDPDSYCNQRLRETDMALNLRCKGYKEHAELRDELRDIFDEPSARDLFSFIAKTADTKNISEEEAVNMIVKYVRRPSPALRALQLLRHQIHPDENDMDKARYPCVYMFSEAA